MVDVLIPTAEHIYSVANVDFEKPLSDFRSRIEELRTSEVRILLLLDCTTFGGLWFF